MAVGFKQISIFNYRSFARVDGFEPDDEVTWLMGSNGSGKSSLLDAIVFPSDLLRGDRQALLAQWRGRPTASGSIDFAALLTDSRQPARWDLTFEDEHGATWRYRLTMEAVGRLPRVVEERLDRLDAAGAVSMLENDERGARMVVADGRWQPFASTDARLVLSHADSVLGAPASAALRFLRGVWLLRPDPFLMRGDAVAYSPEAPPDRYGRDLEGLLDHFIGERPQELGDLLQSIAAVNGWSGLRVTPEGGVRRVVFTEADVLSLPLAMASDGQLLAAWLARLAIAPPDAWTVALLDEPATALAPDVQAQVYGWTRQMAGAVQVFAATHDKSAVDRASRPNVFIVERRSGGTSSLTRLDRHPEAGTYSNLFKAGEVAVQAMRAAEEPPESPE